MRLKTGFNPADINQFQSHTGNYLTFILAWKSGIEFLTAGVSAHPGDHNLSTIYFSSRAPIKHFPVLSRNEKSCIVYVVL